MKTLLINNYMYMYHNEDATCEHIIISLDYSNKNSSTDYGLFYAIPTRYMNSEINLHCTLTNFIQTLYKIKFL